MSGLTGATPLSFGTHFFQDLVELGIFYIAIYPDRQGVLFNHKWLEEKHNLLPELSMKDADYAEVVRVYDVKKDNVKLIADLLTQEPMCFSSSDSII